MPNVRFASLALAALSLGFLPGDDKPQAAGDMPEVANFTFESADLNGWGFTDETAWKVTAEGDNHVLNQHKASKYEPRVRSPFNIALLPDLDVESFVMDLKVRSTARDYGHRDVCLFFGYQDPSHFYYSHLGKEADPHAHSIFLVNDEPRVSIARERTKGTPWTDDWHHVRVVRDVKSGLIAIYYDDMDKPVMSAEDKHFTHGRLGIGTFDDTALFDDIR
ncbi:MAG TPA: hypothetical protein VFT74_10420, partial [Isosphaeraceae bacterium]|nr:hypothetical protein [Isosphaeraceae bacterium]